MTSTEKECGKAFLYMYVFILSLCLVIVSGYMHYCSAEPLTSEERAWLIAHQGKIRLGHDPNARPVEFVDTDGIFKGVAADYIHLIEKKLNFTFQIVSKETWGEVLKDAKNRKIDVLCAFTKNEEREKWMLFTDPYIVIPIVILTRDDIKADLKLSTMQNMKVTFTKGWIVEGYLTSNYSHLTMMPAVNADEAMNNLVTGKADAWITAVTGAAVRIEKHSLTNIRIAGYTDLSFKLAMASRKDWPILNNILTKGLAMISEDEKEKIFNKWVHIKQESIFKNRSFWIIILAILGIAILPAIVISWWNKVLKKKVEEKTEALRESEKKYREVIEGTQDLITQTDRHGNFVFVNKVAEKILGVPPEDGMGMSAFQFIHPDDQDRTVEWFNNAVAEKKKVAKIENRQVNIRTGEARSVLWSSSFHYDLSGSLKGINGIGRDITDYKRSQEALKQSEAYLRTLIFSIPDLVWLKNEAGVYIFCNSRFERLYGAKEDEIIGKTDYDFVEKELADFFRKNDSLAIAKGSPRINEEEVTYADDGHKELLETIKTPIYTKDRQLIGVLGIARDITERRKAEEERRDLETQLRQSQKIEAIGTIAGGIAHDFNNILGIIMGNMELAADSIDDQDAVRLNLEEIKKASLRAGEVIKQLLNYSRKTEQVQKIVDVRLILTESIKLLRSSIPSSIDIQLNLPEELKTIKADPTQVHQVLINLCTNAAHAMEENGGTLKIEVSEIQLDTDTVTQFQEITSGHYIQLTVSDTGHGIDPEIKDSIFDPYFTTKTIEKGTGMGLAIVLGIVKNHNGAISAYSEPEKGSTFKVLFPVADGEVKKDEQVPVMIPGGQETILFVDDEEELVEIGKALLERLGYQVVTTTDPIEALALFKSDPHRFDLIITDLTMPHIKGDQLIKEALSINPQMATVLCSGFNSKIDRKEAVEIGARAYIEKPFDKTTLACSVRKALDET